MTKLRAAAIGAARTIAQITIAVIGTITVIDGINWPLVVSTGALAGCYRC